MINRQAWGRLAIEKGSGERMKPSGVGGMAVMEGVMMKNKDVYAVAVRKPNNEIVVEKCTHKDFSDKLKLFKLPVFRGILAFVDSLVLGIKVLNFSASFFEEEEDLKKKEKAKKKNRKNANNDTQEVEIDELSATNTEIKSLNAEDSKKEDKANALMMLSAVLLSIVLSIGLFMVLPVFLASIFKNFTKNYALINFFEGIIRFCIFIGYVYLASRMNEIKRVFMFHGAEHKTINCIEHGYELTVENVRRQSKEHKRCGTSFTLLVILISLVFFMLVPTQDLLWKIISRIVFVPFIAGVSYEFIRLAGRNESKVVEIISKPGLWMQGLTTKEPDDSMIEVAIQSVDAVFDWRTFLELDKETKKETKKAVTSEKNTKKTTVKAEKEIKPAIKPVVEDESGVEAKTELKAEVKAKTKAPVKPKAKAEVKTEVNAEVKAEVLTEAKNAVKKTVKSQAQVEIKAEAIEEVKVDATSNLKSSETKNKAKSEKAVKSNTSNRPISVHPPVKPSREEEEDDEILKALDKFFDDETNKVAHGK